MKRFIKIRTDRYLVMDSNGKIVSGDEILKYDEEIHKKNKKKNCKNCEKKVDLKGELINDKQSNQNTKNIE